MWGLLPHTLERRSLEDALREEVDQFDSAGKEKVSFNFSGPTCELDVNLQTALLRICQGSLTNIMRHAGPPRCGWTLFSTSRQFVSKCRTAAWGLTLRKTPGTETEASA